MQEVMQPPVQLDTRSVNSDELIAVFFENTEQEVSDFLERQSVKDAYTVGQKTFDAIAAAQTPEEKVAAFQQSRLNEYRTHMLQEGCVFSEEERKLLDSVNKKLAGNVGVEKVLFGEGLESGNGFLLAVLKKQLEEKNVGSVVDDEVFHYQSVYELAKEFFPNNFVLHMAAFVHDSHKYDSAGKRQLGLHELASTASAEALARELLQLLVEKNLVALLPEEIAVVAKAVARATYTHGMDEYPAMMSSKTPVQGVDSLFWLWGELYAHPGEAAIPKNIAEKTDTLNGTIAGLNLVDILVGCDIPSFKKYNKNWVTNALAEKSLQSYLQEGIFASLSTNLTNTSYLYFAEHALDGVPVRKILEKMNLYTERAAIVQFLLDVDSTFVSTITTHVETFVQQHPNLISLAERVKTAYSEIGQNYESFTFAERQLEEITEKIAGVAAAQQAIEATFTSAEENWPQENRWEEYAAYETQLDDLAEKYDDVLAFREQNLQQVDASRLAFDQAFEALLDAVTSTYTPEQTSKIE